jgi:hypothetical protein
MTRRVPVHYVVDPAGRYDIGAVFAYGGLRFAGNFFNELKVGWCEFETVLKAPST